MSPIKYMNLFHNRLLCAIGKTAERFVDSVSKHIVDPCLLYASILIYANKYVDNKNFRLVGTDRRAPAPRHILLNASDIIKTNLGKRLGWRCFHRIACDRGQGVGDCVRGFLALLGLARFLGITRGNLRISKILQHTAGSIGARLCLADKLVQLVTDHILRFVRLCCRR